MDHFEKEAEFEQNLIAMLQRYGWEKEVLHSPTEEDLIQNWANILFENNREIDRLNDCPLNREEMEELLEQIKRSRTPLALNSFINGKTVSLTRKNPKDTLHYGKEISLKIYDRMEIAAGQSRYQIAEQPIFLRRDKILPDRRGDLMLLINGMPLFHIELKRSGVPVQEAVHQIEKYAHEGIFSGLFSLVQVFVAMNPEETLYFANPGPDGSFNPDFYFHWADRNNDPINHWQKVAERLLSIPMAHQLIGFYTVADDSDGILKVMRSYQYYAANKISDQVAKHDWSEKNQLGGYIWHTTGSGKTMTSFKSAQLIANSKDADKVVFLIDRVELGDQSLTEYKAFSDSEEDVQGTDNTMMLIFRLKSMDPKNTLIVTSIQKMSKIKEDAKLNMRTKDLEEMQSKRIVFIVDECHRSSSGEMLITIKETFPKALFFGFSGTPLLEENQRKSLTTADIFGNELHRYSIADGIRDKNVLGFDPTMVSVYRAKDLRKKVALHESGAASEQEALSDPVMRKKYFHFMSQQEVPMAGSLQEDGSYRKGIEDYIGKEAWQTEKYHSAVVTDIMENWLTLSRNNKFHAIFATSSIPEAIQYYKIFRENYPDFKVTGLFDPTIDNVSGEKALDKEDGLREMLIDYNRLYNQSFDLSKYALFKQDVSERLSHKNSYGRIKEEEQLNLLIVVNQMLTGFDSKWINTLYLDKILLYQNLIQAFSRTNRLYNINEKPFGSIRYYRMPYTMKQNIEEAVKLYSGDRPEGLFADHLSDNIRHMNLVYEEMKDLFANAGISDMEKLPEDVPAKAKFAKLFREFNNYLQAARIQGFQWDRKEYIFSKDSEDGDILSIQEGDRELKEKRRGEIKELEIKEIDYLEEIKLALQKETQEERDKGSASLEAEETKKEVLSLLPSEDIFRIMVQRYKELRPRAKDKEDGEITFPIDPYLTEENTGVIDHEYMNSRFQKWKKVLEDPNADPKLLESTLAELHKSFAFLSQEDQKYANLFLHDVQTGDAKLSEELSFQDYIVRYAKDEKSEQIKQVVQYLGISEKMLSDMLRENITEDNLNEYGRFDALKETVDRNKAQDYFSKIEGETLPPFMVNNRVEKLLTDFIFSGGFAILSPEKDAE